MFYLLAALFAPFASLAPAEESALPALERTLSIIKPDAVASADVDDILSYFTSEGLDIIASKEVQLTEEQARAFYAEHKDKPFFEDLIAFMTSGPVIVQVLEGEDAVALNRKVMGATDPAVAEPGTIRADFGSSKTANAVHGSDSPASASREISFFFNPEELDEENR
jgi:nucleoside-diphosphate kinase